jgi:phage baseplate assembly protein W
LFTLALRDGDLQIAGGSYALHDGAAKTQQDVGLALGEPLGNDRFHPGFGSTLWTFIGLPLSPAALLQVQQEASRVVQNYAAIQYDQIQSQVLQQTASRFSTAEIIGQVSSVDVTGLLDTITIKITIQTVDEQDLVLSASIGGGNA